jgi:hypothetical protein
MVLLAAASACAPLGSGKTGWADLPMAGLSESDEVPLARLQGAPASFEGQTVRTSVRVADAERSPQGIFLFVVPRGAPLEAAALRLLVLPEQGGDEFLGFRGRDLVLVMRVDGLRTILGVHDPAVIVTPVSHVSLFGYASEGGEAATAAREQIEGADAMPDDAPAP